MNTNITYVGPSRLLDSEEHFFSEMFITIQHADPDYLMLLNKQDDKVICHITPSNQNFRQAIIDNLLHFNRLKPSYRIRFSSSLKISQKVSFTVC